MKMAREFGAYIGDFVAVAAFSSSLRCYCEFFCCFSALVSLHRTKAMENIHCGTSERSTERLNDL